MQQIQALNLLPALGATIYMLTNHTLFPSYSLIQNLVIQRLCHNSKTIPLRGLKNLIFGFLFFVQYIRLQRESAIVKRPILALACRRWRKTVTSVVNKNNWLHLAIALWLALLLYSCIKSSFHVGAAFSFFISSIISPTALFFCKRRKEKNNIIIALLPLCNYIKKWNWYRIVVFRKNT